MTELGEQVANNIRMTSGGETTVLKFKAGDRVRMHPDGEEGVVVALLPGGVDYPVGVKFGEDRDAYYCADWELELVESVESRRAEPELAEWEKELLEPGDPFIAPPVDRKAEHRAAVQAEVAGMDDDDLSYEYDYVSDLVLQWQALDAHIDNYLMRLNELTAEMNRRDSRDSVLTALSYVPIEKIMALVTDQELDLGNGLVVTRK